MRWDAFGKWFLVAVLWVAAPVQATVFDFDDGTPQGWTTAGAYTLEPTDPFLIPVPGFFWDVPADWMDEQDSPGSPPSYDPLGNGIGSIALGHSWHSYPVGSEDVWVWDFESPDLSLDSQWQGITEIEADVTSTMATGTTYSRIWVQFILWVKKPNGSEALFAEEPRIFYEIPIDILYAFNAWQTYSMDVQSLWDADLPAGSTIQNLLVRVFGEEDSYGGYVFLDNVTPFGGGACPGELGGDADGDGICDGGPFGFCTDGETTSCKDNCPYVSNPGQEDTGGIGSQGPDGIGDACQCGDVTGDGQVNSADATMITRRALALTAPAFNVPCNCDVTNDGKCNSADATMVVRKALSLTAPPFGNYCGNYTDICDCDSNGNCFP